MTDYLDPGHSPRDVVRRAMLMAGELDVAQGGDVRRELAYWDALEDVHQWICNLQPWWFLQRVDKRFATKVDRLTYDLRAQSSATVSLTGNVADTNTITINSRVYEFDTNGAITGNVAVDVSAAVTPAAAADALVAAINGDASREVFALETSTGVVELYWLGDDGYGKTVTRSGTNITVDAAFTYTLRDFGRLTALNLWDYGPLAQRPTRDAVEFIAPQSGLPCAYSFAGVSTLALWSTTAGPPDDVYRVELAYQAQPSAIRRPDKDAGGGQIALPPAFHDILPRAVVALMRADRYDERAPLGDSWVRRRLDELKAYQVDTRPSGADGRGFDFQRSQLSVIQDERVTDYPAR